MKHTKLQYLKSKALIANTFDAVLINNLAKVLGTAWANAPNETERADVMEVWKPIVDLNNALLTDKLCPKCKAFLYLSDVPDYEYVCPYCNEKTYFYECEV